MEANNITLEEFDKLPFERQLTLYNTGNLPLSVKTYIKEYEDNQELSVESRMVGEFKI